jgi:hypothetical protein
MAVTFPVHALWREIESSAGRKINLMSEIIKSGGFSGIALMSGRNGAHSTVEGLCR